MLVLGLLTLLVKADSLNLGCLSLLLFYFLVGWYAESHFNLLIILMRILFITIDELIGWHLLLTLQINFFHVHLLLLRYKVVVY